jgi:DNA-binding transcriptional regulator LsrR (DeoR family)
MASGAVGEICGWIYDADGRILDHSVNERVASVPIPSRQTCMVIGMAQGTRKNASILAALRGGLLNGLITDEVTSEYLLTN